MADGWWRDFHSAELDQLISRAIAANLTLQAAAARIDEARASAGIAAAAAYPQATIAGTLDHGQGVNNSSTQQLLAQVSLALDLWGRTRALTAAGTALAQAAGFDRDEAAITLSATLADEYFQILSLDERIRLARRIAEDARHVLALVEVQRAAGTATELQVQQQLAATATFEAAVPALRLQAEIATHAVAVLAGMAPEGFAIRAGDLGGLAQPLAVPMLPPALLRRRADVAAAEARLIAANFDIGAARAAWFPAISLNAAAGLGAEHLSRLFAPAALTGFGASLLQPVLQGGQLRQQLRLDRAQRQELAASYRQTVLAAFEDVEDALSALEQVQQQEAIQATADQAAQKAAALAELQYRLGSADYLTVLTTEQAAYQAHDALLQLRVSRLQAMVGLFRALGGGFDADAAVNATAASKMHTG